MSTTVNEDLDIWFERGYHDEGVLITDMSEDELAGAMKRLDARVRKWQKEKKKNAERYPSNSFNRPQPIRTLFPQYPILKKELIKRGRAPMVKHPEVGEGEEE